MSEEEKEEKFIVGWRMSYFSDKNPPSLPGGPEDCSLCKSKIYISDRSRKLKKVYPDIIYVCNFCAKKKQQQDEGELLFNVPDQRRNMDIMLRETNLDEEGNQ